MANRIDQIMRQEPSHQCLHFPPVSLAHCSSVFHSHVLSENIRPNVIIDLIFGVQILKTLSVTVFMFSRL